MQAATTCKAVVASAAQARASRARPSPRLFTPAVAAPARRQRLHVTAAAAVEAKAGEKYPAWELIYKKLVEEKVQSIGAVDANDMVVVGKAVLIDVRPAEDHEKAHPQGAVHVPAFLVIDTPSGIGEFGKWLACRANGVTPTKPNPELASLVAKAAADGKAVILACEAGGTLEPTINFPQGKVSRSLKAIWKVVTSGVLPADRVLHLAGGVYEWNAAGMPMVGEYDGAGAGRTPAAAGTPTGQYFKK